MTTFNVPLLQALQETLQVSWIFSGVFSVPHESHIDHLYPHAPWLAQSLQPQVQYKPEAVV